MQIATNKSIDSAIQTVGLITYMIFPYTVRSFAINWFAFHQKKKQNTVKAQHIQMSDKFAFAIWNEKNSNFR